MCRTTPSAASAAISLVRVAGLAQDLGRVLADVGRRGRMERPLAVERQRERGERADRGSAGGATCWRMPSACVCSALGDVGDVRDRRGGDAGGGEPLGATRRCRRPRAARRAARRARRGSARGRGSSGSVGRRRAPAARRPRRSSANRRSLPPAIISSPSARREDLVRRDHREARSLAARHGAVREVAGEVVADVPDAPSRTATRRRGRPPRCARARAAPRGRRARPRCPSPGRSATSRRARLAGRARPSSR